MRPGQLLKWENGAGKKNALVAHEQPTQKPVMKLCGTRHCGTGFTYKLYKIYTHLFGIGQPTKELQPGLQHECDFTVVVACTFKRNNYYTRLDIYVQLIFINIYLSQMHKSPIKLTRYTNTD